ncbi:glycosyltransferase family 1 protein [Vibrio vulnificus]|uniref:glycosyltransferase family 4 protein n=1 Tax=Vibrio vulnificus TaxID=672 RepID=UPI000DABD549|nr:glycosyltransferase family 1 protein [Vibrio vulnificus]MDK2683652.1 glycosyltransferase family 1 protein [Vibrio vulnificus]RAH25988.1 glycosyltransferase family 1 protein [Vibrio vulnificus]
MIYLDGLIFSLQKSGGISVYFAEIIKNISGLDVNLFTGFDENNIYKEYRLSSLDFKCHSSRFLERYRDIELGDEYRVFHSSYYRLPVKKNRHSIKVVSTIHDFTYERYIGGLRGAIHSKQKRNAVMNSDEVICISESTKNDLLEFIPEAKNKNIHVIHNGVSGEFTYTKNNEVNNNVLFVGSRVGYKNFINVVKSLASHTNLALKIIGGGPLSVDEKKLLDFYLLDRYEYLGFVSNRELNELYNSSFCLLYPSEYEGFGIPILEAMKSGCPFIALDRSSIPEVAGDAGILLGSSDPKLISSALGELYSTHNRNELVKLGLKNSQGFSWKSCAENVNQIYFG